MYDDIVLTNGKIINIKAGMLIPDNATNGDMIKALFPNDKVIEDAFIEVMHYGNYKQILSDWWNAPYKAGKRGKE